MTDHPARPAGRGRSVKLAWVQVDGQDVPVAAFDGLAPAERPQATCGACGEPVTLKLGEQRAPHAAHRPEAACALTAPESALHYNAKMHLAEVLRHAQSLELSYACPGPGTDAYGYQRPCDEKNRVMWQTPWDGVEVERLVDARRPDILLLQGGRPVGAIEVRVTHAVDAAKARALASSRLPWVEVLGRDLWGPDGARWVDGSPMPAHAGSDGLLPPCDACTRKRAAEEALRAQVVRHARERELALADFRRAAEHRAQTAPYEGLHVRRIRVFDRFLRSGDVERDALVLADIRAQGRVVDSVLFLASDLRTLRAFGGPAAGQQWRTLRETADSWLREQAAGADLDAPDQWFDPERALGRRDFVKGWAEDGLEHRWRGATAPAAWRVGEDGGFADDLDLLRYLFTTYWSGLPCRRQWSSKQQKWFQTVALSAVPWRLWEAAP